MKVTTGVGGGQSKHHGVVVWRSPFLIPLGAVLWIRLLVAGLWPWMSGFSPSSVYIGFGSGFSPILWILHVGVTPTITVIPIHLLPPLHIHSIGECL